MARLNTSKLTPMQRGKLIALLAKRARYDGEVMTLGEHIATLQGVKSQGDGMIDWNRRRFNKMLAQEQRAYEDRLKAKRYFYVDGWQVPKIVWDCIIAPDSV